ncbi:MAG: hypothetical protein KGI00_01515 [Candidatus Micrarchaeota archaeon]|nr:hypothetical protein [Candidatus Micrarchaeota archaeon]MDE1849387.1 hypothetical protein [Candidatus Micrarchaeota archaeon]
MMLEPQGSTISHHRSVFRKDRVKMEYGEVDRILQRNTIPSGGPPIS